MPTVAELFAAASRHYEAGQRDRALECLQAVLRQKPDLPEAHSNLGMLLAEAGRLGEAVASFREAIRLRPDFTAGYSNLGNALRELGRFDEARACFQQALSLNANDPAAHCNLGALLEDCGDLEGAARCFQEGVRHDPANVAALAGLATMLRGKLPEPELARMRDRLADPQVRDGPRARLLFALAHVLDARGEYDQAAAHLQEANDLELTHWQQRGQAFDPVEFNRFIDRMQQAFNPAFFERVRGWGLVSERPVFIFGLPRSGTTLTEQVLASHSQVHGGGELRFAENDFEALRQMTTLPGTTPVPAIPALAREQQLDEAFAALHRLDRAAVRHLAEQHLHWLESLNPSRARVTSKTPSNWRFLGLLATLFPRARFIHCRRDLRDVAVSCWMTHFRLLNWTCDPDHIAARFQAYERLMTHWRTTLPVPMLELDYEAMVADLEGTARRLVSWLGLEWEPACLEFHKTRRPVRTASAAQVRQPIYRSSVGRWRHYAGALAPLLAKCAPANRSAENSSRSRTVL